MRYAIIIMRYLKAFTLLLWILIRSNTVQSQTFDSAKHVKIVLIDVDSSVAVKKNKFVAPRTYVDIALAPGPAPTFGFKYVLNRNLKDKNMLFVRLGMVRNVYFDVAGIIKCPFISTGYSRGVFESSFGMFVKQAFSGKQAKGFPYVNIGLHTPTRILTFRCGLGFPEIFYAGIQIGLF